MNYTEFFDTENEDLTREEVREILELLLLLRDHKDEYCVDLSQYTKDEKEEPEIFQRVQDKLPLYTKFMPTIAKTLFLYYRDKEGYTVRDGKLYDQEGKEADIIMLTLNYVIASCIMQGEAREPAKEEPTNSKLTDLLQIFGSEGIDLQFMTEPPETQLAKVTFSPTNKIEYPMDKVNSYIWRLLEKDTQGQIALAAERSNSKKALNIFYAIDFSELEGLSITKKLQPFDKRVYIAIAALFNGGNDVMTVSQIYRQMGFTGAPGKSDREKINAAVTKMSSAKIFVDNQEEAAAYKGYARFRYDGSLLPMERRTDIVNGQVTESTIHIFREPPLISWAKQRNQITTVDVKLLQSPMSKTDSNLAIDDYLIERISRAKAGKQPAKILFKTLAERTGNTTAKQKQRLPEKVKRYLDHYRSCGLITEYVMATDGVTVSFRRSGAKGHS